MWSHRGAACSQSPGKACPLRPRDGRFPEPPVCEMGTAEQMVPEEKGHLGGAWVGEGAGRAALAGGQPYRPWTSWRPAGAASRSSCHSPRSLPLPRQIPFWFELERQLCPRGPSPAVRRQPPCLHSDPAPPGQALLASGPLTPLPECGLQDRGALPVHRSFAGSRAWSP